MTPRTSAFSLHPTTRTILTQLSCFIFSFTMFLVFQSRYQFLIARESTSLPFFSLSYLILCNLDGLWVYFALFIPLVFFFWRGAERLACLLLPLNLLFFCLELEFTLGIVDSIYNYGDSYWKQGLLDIVIEPLMQTSYTMDHSQIKFLNTLLPKGYSLQPALMESKRVRVVKKLDQSFASEFVVNGRRREQQGDKSCQSSSKKQMEKQEVDGSKAVNLAKDISAVSTKQDELKPKHTSLTLPQRIMTTFLLKLKMHKSSWPFRMPIDPVCQDVPNYSQIVRQSMDLKTIDRKIKTHGYQDEKGLDRDVRLIIANSYAFNSQDTVYYTLTKDFQGYYEELWKEYRKDPQVFGNWIIERERREAEEYKQDVQVTPKKKISMREKVSSGKKKAIDIIPQQKQEVTLKVLEQPARTMSNLPFNERQQLFHKINSLSQNGIKNLIKHLNGANSLKGEWQQLQIDLSKLSALKFKKLQQFLCSPSCS